MIVGLLYVRKGVRKGTGGIEPPVPFLTLRLRSSQYSHKDGERILILNNNTNPFYY